LRNATGTNKKIEIQVKGEIMRICSSLNLGLGQIPYSNGTTGSLSTNARSVKVYV
jgi:hypothetical protein